MRKSRKIPDKLLKKREILGHFLRDSRLNSGLSQTDVAQIFNFATPQFISNWENGRSSPPLKYLDKLCRIYSMDLEKFYDIMVDHAICLAEIRTRQNLSRAIFKRKA
jgi:transcriptional regulator with XRE-family HTH domain